MYINTDIYIQTYIYIYTVQEVIIDAVNQKVEWVFYDGSKKFHLPHKQKYLKLFEEPVYFQDMFKKLEELPGEDEYLYQDVILKKLIIKNGYLILKIYFEEEEENETYYYTFLEEDEEDEDYGVLVSFFLMIANPFD